MRCNVGESSRHFNWAKNEQNFQGLAFRNFARCSIIIQLARAQFPTNLIYYLSNLLNDKETTNNKY